jgi:hypothetical protein
MTNEMLNPSQVFQLKEGLLLRIKQLEENIVACKELGQDEYVKYWEKSLNEAKIVNKAFNSCFVVTLQ